MTARFVAAHESYSMQWAVSDEMAEPGDWKAIVFRGSEIEAKAVATALLRANGLHLSVSAESVADERGATLSMLADANDEAEAYNALVELIDATLGGGDDPEAVARRLVTRFHLGSVCPRCEFVYLQQETPEECEICQEKLAA